MATSGSIAGQEINGQKAYLFWSYTQNITNRTTTITFTFKVKRTDTGWTTNKANANTYIEAPDGTDIYNQSTFDYDITSVGVGSYITICSASKTFQHGTDGKIAPITCDSGIDLTGTSVGEYLNATGSVDPADIPVGSDFEWVAGVVIGEDYTIAFKPIATAYTHTIKREWQGTLETVATGVQGTVGVEIQVDSFFELDMALHIPNTDRGSVTLIIETYSGATLIGTKTRTWTITLLSTVKPTITTLTGAVAGDAISQAWNKFIKGKSKINFAWSGVAGAYGSTIVSWAITATGYNYTGTSSATSGSKLSDLVNFVGALTFTLTITDSRGRTGTKTVVITGVDYASPVISSFSASRGTGGVKNDDGTQIITSQVYSFSSCGGSNALTVQKVNIMQLPSGAWGSDNTTATGVDKVCPGTFSADLSFYCRLTITDAYGSVYAYDTVQPSFSILEIYGATGKGLAIGKKATLDNTFEVDLISQFNKGFAPLLIADSTDLNNLRICGFYRCPTSAGAQTLANCPTTVAFNLFMEGGGLFYRQTLTEYTSVSPYTYTRNYYNGTWGAWVRNLNTGVAGYAINALGSLTSATLDIADEILIADNSDIAVPKKLRMDSLLAFFKMAVVTSTNIVNTTTLSEIQTYLTIDADWTISTLRIDRWGAFVSLYVNATRGTALGVGNITNDLICTLKSSNLFPAIITGFTNASGGDVMTGYVDQSGGCYISATRNGGTVMNFGVTYLT